MALVTLGGLAILALIDSTSFGTLGLPVLMLARHRVAVRPFLAYLGVIAGFYVLLGIALLGGANLALPGLAAAGDSAPVLRAQIGVGVALFAVSFLIDKRGRAWLRSVRGRPAPTPGSSRHDRWAARITGPNADLRVVTGVALAAGLVEAASMLPYLGAIGLLAAAPLAVPGKIAVLVGYAGVMVLPALALLGARLALAHRIEPALRRVHAWIDRYADDTLGWVVGIVGFLVAADGVSRLAQVTAVTGA